jgi:hypothetical protein
MIWAQSGAGRSEKVEGVRIFLGFRKKNASHDPRYRRTKANTRGKRIRIHKDNVGGRTARVASKGRRRQRGKMNSHADEGAGVADVRNVLHFAG